jgi:hypothetical protein
MSGIDKVIIAYAMKKFLKVTYGVWIKMGELSNVPALP